MKRKDLLTDFFGLSASLRLLLPKNTYPFHDPVFGYVFLFLLGSYLNDIAHREPFLIAPYSSSTSSGTEDLTRIVRMVTGPIRPLFASCGKLE